MTESKIETIVSESKIKNLIADRKVQLGLAGGLAVLLIGSFLVGSSPIDSDYVKNSLESEFTQGNMNLKFKSFDIYECDEVKQYNGYQCLLDADAVVSFNSKYKPLNSVVSRAVVDFKYDKSADQYVPVDQEQFFTEDVMMKIGIAGLGELFGSFN
ncbi:hypothetical protein I3271_09155 [Photobacterium leiognathi]|uniref:hypothetical protein n=1 Tax=Photobacterium leiognathi TaxID=553611 RepID=UPI001EDE3FAE|nr:hypothetical protein [Photobacterium leiognathi]MCG3884856.1 hypothetical protein [Photobacterium leiognathi]